MDLYGLIMEAIDNMSTSDLVYLWDNFCDEVGAYDDAIYPMDDMDERLDGMSAWEIARATWFGRESFNPTDKYYYFNGYGNLNSTNYPETMISKDDLVSEIIDRNDSFFNSEIQEILDDVESGLDSY